MTPDTLADFFEASRASVILFDTWAEKTKPQAAADHICYKCVNTSEFEHLRALFESPDGFIYQSIISGRRIAIIRFEPPIMTALGEIRTLELSDQKPDNSQTSGFDHIEIYPTSGSVEELAESLSLAGTVLEKVVRPHHTTYDAVLAGTFKVRLEAEALIEKIKRDEMR